MLRQSTDNARTPDEGAAQGVALALLPPLSTVSWRANLRKQLAWLCIERARRTAFAQGPHGGMLANGVEVGWDMQRNGAQELLWFRGRK